MKKGLLILLSALFGLMIFSAVAFAQAGAIPHGGFTADTNKCKDCHGMHNRNNKRLLAKSSTTDFCFDCHGQVAYGSFYAPGKLVDPATGIAGFDIATVKAGPGSPVNSMHNVFTGNAGTLAYDPTQSLSDNANFFTATTDTRFSYTFGNGFTCGSCHDPHGNGVGNNFRLLRTYPLGQSTVVTENKVGDGVTTVFFLEGTRQAEPALANGKALLDSAAPAGVDTGDVVIGGVAQTVTAVTEPGGVGKVWQVTLNAAVANGTPFTLTYTLAQNAVAITAAANLTADGQSVPTYTSGMDTFCTTCHDRNVMQKNGAGQWVRHPSNVALTGPINTNYTAYKPAIVAPAGLAAVARARDTANPNINLQDLASAVTAGTYYYRITAIDASGAETAGSGEVSAVAANSQIIDVTWNKVASASGYKLYKNSASGGNKLMVTLPGKTTSYQDRAQNGFVGVVFPGAPVGVGTSPQYGARVPVESGANAVFCLSCHNAHTSIATNGKLLKEEGSNTCQQCHNK